MLHPRLDGEEPAKISYLTTNSHTRANMIQAPCREEASMDGEAVLEDLRRRMVEAIDGGAAIPDAAEQCGVSISSVVRFLKHHRDTGSVSAAKFGGYKEFLLAVHEEWSGI